MPDSKRKTIIESIREYVRMYPDIDNRKINIDYLGDGMEYSIDPIGVDPIYKRYIVVVDLFEQKTSETTCTARKRTWSVIPDTEGDGTDALIYKGSFKAAGEITKGTATTTDGWKTCTFTAGGE